MTLLDIGMALMAVVPECYHLEATKQTDKYIVWGEYGQAGSMAGNNVILAQAIAGDAHYFTKTEFDPNVEKIQEALNDLGIPWRLNSIQYEPDTRYQHFEWLWELDVEVGDSG